MFNCETCQVKVEQAKLTPANLRAMQLYSWLSKPVTIDLHLTQAVFDYFRVSATAEEAQMLLESLDLIHSERQPKRESRG